MSLGVLTRTISTDGLLVSYALGFAGGIIRDTDRVCVHRRLP